MKKQFDNVESLFAAKTEAKLEKKLEYSTSIQKRIFKDADNAFACTVWDARRQRNSIYDLALKHSEDKRDIIIYGESNSVNWAVERLIECFLSSRFFCHSEHSEQRSITPKLNVISKDQLIREHKNDYIAISSKYHFHSLADQLYAKGIPNENIFIIPQDIQADGNGLSANERITSLDRLKQLLDVDCSRVLDRITDKTKIIIWGMGDLGNRIINSFSPDEYPNIVVWDKALRDKKWAGGVIQYPDSETCSLEDKENALFIIAIYDAQIYHEISCHLKKSGCMNILWGSAYIRHKAALKVINDYEQYDSSNADPDFSIDDKNLYLITTDIYKSAGDNLDGAYLNQDLWAARKIFSEKPAIHYDIGSRVDGFITHLLSFNQKTVLIDIRPLDTRGIDNLTFVQADATNLSEFKDESIESLSALCSPEHFGLGRYGDPIDPEAHNKLFENMQRVIKRGGDLYISVPVSKECHLEFNAHRIYAPRYIINKFSLLDLVEFSVVYPNKGIIRNFSANNVDMPNGVGASITGLFHFKKRNSPLEEGVN